MHILDVRIDEVTVDEAKAKAQGFLHEQKLRRIFTPNPEILVAAHRHDSFRSILNTADLSLCDGKGLSFFSEGKLNRITGVDFMLELLGIAEKEHKSVFLLGSGKTKTVKKLFDFIQTTYPNLHVAGMHPGPNFFIRKGAIVYKTTEEKRVNQQVVEEIQRSKPDILFVAFGHEKQEIWIDTHAKDLKGVKIAMGVGGAFDYISGSVRRAPKWLRVAGFEWLYRFFTQPKRFARIITAIIIFPYYALTKSR